MVSTHRCALIGTRDAGAVRSMNSGVSVTIGNGHKTSFSFIRTAAASDLRPSSSGLPDAGRSPPATRGHRRPGRSSSNCRRRLMSPRGGTSDGSNRPRRRRRSTRVPHDSTLPSDRIRLIFIKFFRNFLEIFFSVFFLDESRRGGP